MRDGALWREYGRLMAQAIGKAADRHLYEMEHGWDETLPRTFWQRLFRRPATVVHHKGFGEVPPLFDQTRRAARD